MKRLMLNQEQLAKWGRNVLMFTAPALAVFFYQLSQGVAIEQAVLIAALALWGLLADYFKKLESK